MGDDNELLPREFCVSQLGGMPESVNDCRVECGFDARLVDHDDDDARLTAGDDARHTAPTLCLLSEWTKWTVCEHGCNGITTRERVMQVG